MSSFSKFVCSAECYSPTKKKVAEASKFLKPEEYISFDQMNNKN